MRAAGEATSVNLRSTRLSDPNCQFEDAYTRSTAWGNRLSALTPELTGLENLGTPFNSGE
jgi:hypothetical protein